MLLSLDVCVSVSDMPSDRDWTTFFVMVCGYPYHNVSWMLGGIYAMIKISETMRDEEEAFWKWPKTKQTWFMHLSAKRRRDGRYGKIDGLMALAIDEFQSSNPPSNSTYIYSQKITISISILSLNSIPNYAYSKCNIFSVWFPVRQRQFMSQCAARSFRLRPWFDHNRRHLCGTPKSSVGPLLCPESLQTGVQAEINSDE